ncbi:hypothetical protein H0H81_005206, partial [Sphagnurus paluster]
MSDFVTPSLGQMEADLHECAGHFGIRILVIGQANCGKTTILQKLYNATKEPEIFDVDGNKVCQM